jgi:predicted phosphoribosyltransferase
MYCTTHRPSYDKASGSSPLARKLWLFRKSSCLLAATTPIAVGMAAALGHELGLAHYRHYCKALIHPAQGNQTIGSMTSHEVVLHDDFTALPQGYVEHQVALMRHLLQRENRDPRPSIADKTIILVRETLEGPDQVNAAVEELRKVGASSVLLATPVVNRKVIQTLEDLADGLIYGAIDLIGMPLRSGKREFRGAYADVRHAVEQFEFE